MENYLGFPAGISGTELTTRTLLQAQKVASDVSVWLRITLGLTAIIGVWTLLHTAFTLHYAGLYYADPDMTESLEFRGGPHVRNFDDLIADPE